MGGEHRQDSAWCLSHNWASDGKMELKQGRERRGVPLPPLDREQEVVGSLNKWVPLKLLDVPQITANIGSDLGR